MRVEKRETSPYTLLDVDFTQGLIDRSQYGHTLTNVGSQNRALNGQYFDGVDDYITVDSNIELLKKSLHVKGSVILNNTLLQVIITTKEDVGSSAADGYAIYYESNRFYLSLSDGTNRIKAYVVGIDKNKKYDIDIVYHYPNNVQIAINGINKVTVVEGDSMTTNVLSSYGCTIGRDIKTTRFLNGEIKNLLVEYF